MRFIHKQRAWPQPIQDGLLAHFKTPCLSDYYGSFRDKQSLKKHLLNEQNGLCAYCNQGITLTQSTIEHLVCQSHNRGLDLNYHNLFLVCKGNPGSAKKQHCDRYRGQDNAYFFPFILFEQAKTTSWEALNPFFELGWIKAINEPNGFIKPSTSRPEKFPNLQKPMQGAIEALNLNADVLVQARLAQWQAVLQTKISRGLDWPDLFAYYLQQPNTPFIEFVLLAIKKAATV